MNHHPPVLSDYAPAFSNPGELFVTHHFIRSDKSVGRREVTRGELWSLALKAARVLRDRGAGPGACFAHYFSGNRVEDLAFRLGATIVGAAPVTVNWQADTPERVAYKIELTESRLLVFDRGVPAEALEDLARRAPDLSVFAIEDLASQPELPETDVCADVDGDATRIIIFTSGTTGRPKGVRLSYRNYAANRATFESFLRVAEGDAFAPLIVNPLHHTNSTAFTDWAMRRPRTHLHLVERYSTQYWRIVAQVAAAAEGRIVAPAVSRHFDYLEDLIAQDGLPLPQAELEEAMRKVEFLLGSAPVGPTTVRRLKARSGRLPLVRFGSTETCLQVMGTPLALPEEETLRAFERGWAHTHRGEPACGYYVGRPHPPHTEVRIVRSADPEADDYFADCDEGEPGRIITRGENVMPGYVRDDEATRKVLHPGGWYTGLGDVGFRLGEDCYWMSREASLMIRGGANYACAQVAAELKAFAAGRYGLGEDAFDVAVVGLRIESEHEDSCCVTIELRSDDGQRKEAEMEESFLAEARASVTKGARPDRVRFAPVPRNFKGAVEVPRLKEEYLSAIKAGRDAAHDRRQG